MKEGFRFHQIISAMCELCETLLLFSLRFKKCFKPLYVSAPWVVKLFPTKKVNDPLIHWWEVPEGSSRIFCA